MNVIINLENDLKIGLNDIETAAKEIGIDIIDGISFLEKIFSNLSTDLTAINTVVSIINPILAKEIVTTAQIVGTISSVINILLKINPENLSSSLTEIESEIKNLSVIWNAQKQLIENISNSIAKEITVITNTGL